MKSDKITESARVYRANVLAQKGELRMVRWYDGAWSFILSYQPTGETWGFSAQLYPRGRGSVEKDWKLLGMWAAGVKAPETSLFGDTIRTAPNAVHKWIWVEKSVDSEA